MRKLSFLASLLVTISLIFVLDNSYHTSNFSIPALGKFLNPVTGFWKNADLAKPIPITFPIESDSLLSDVKVIYDERLIPHIFANNPTDAYFAQGYVTAQNRLWQMDFMVRSTAGRLAEVVGEKALKRDKYKRRLGLPYAAENTLNVWKSDSSVYAIAEAYAQGVNAYIESLNPADYPMEYKLLDYEPEKWTPMHMALITKAMAETLCLRARDVEITNAKAMFSEQTFKFLYPDYFPEQRPIIPKEVIYAFADSDKKEIEEEPEEEEIEGYLGELEMEFSDENIGSNNWAIARGKSTTGNAIFAGDPHLMLTLPSIWFEVQIHTPEMNTYGVSIPGLPGVTIGFNDHIAWSMTNTGHDVADFYSLKWKDETHQAYLLDSQWVEVQKRVEKYTVRSDFYSTEEVDTVRFTNWGPVITENDSTADLALRWMAHDAPAKNDLSVFYEVNKAKNKEEFEEALLNYASPSQNIAFASKNGDIGLFITGDWPIKRKGQGRFIQDGTKSANAWKGIIPRDHMPKVVNPEWGYVGSANQHSTTKNYPYFYNNENFEGYRGRYIQLQLTPNIAFSEEDMRNMQQESYSLKVEDLFDMMVAPLDFDRLNDAEKAVFTRLQKWNYRYERQALNPVYFEEWFRIFYEKVWDEIDNSPYKKILYPSHWRTVYIMRDLPESNFFDIKSTPERETCSDIITIAFQEMVKGVTARLLVEPDLNWSNFRNTKVTHLAQIDAFSEKNIYTDGYRRALNAVTSRTGPSWRMVVEMDSIPKAKVVYPGGQSGNPGSPFYANFLDEWAEGTYFDANFMQSSDDEVTSLIVQEFKSNKK